VVRRNHSTAIVHTIAATSHNRHRPYLAGDCGYFGVVGDQAAWAACRYALDSMVFPALALLVLPPPLVLILGYWIVRGFRPDYARFNKRVAIGVALMPVWGFIIVLNLTPPKTPAQIRGAVIVNLLLFAVFVVVHLGLMGLLTKSSQRKPGDPA
jgi:hypothetical protein